MTQRRRDRDPDAYSSAERKTMKDAQADSKLLLTIPEAAYRLGLGRSFVYQLVMRGDIPSIKLGRARRIPVAALEEFVATRLQESDY